jgi:hypothetical protein
VHAAVPAQKGDLAVGWCEAIYQLGVKATMMCETVMKNTELQAVTIGWVAPKQAGQNLATQYKIR